MSEEEVTTPVGKLISIYNKYNKSSFDANYLVCAECNSWLTSAICIIEGGQNICKGCCTAKTSTFFRNYSLEKLLVNGKYPCKYNSSGCKVFDAYKNLIEHEQVCTFNISCFCKLHLKSRNDIMDHMKMVHSMETIKLSRAVADIPMKIPEPTGAVTVLPYHLECGSTSLVALVMRDAASHEISVIILNVTDTPRHIKFMVKINLEGAEYQRYGEINDTVLEPTSASVNFPNMKSNNDFLIKIYFDKYEEIEPFESYFETILKESECPICMEIITDVCYQCVNGHNVCAACKEKVQICPSCRLSISNTQTQLKRLVELFKRPCKNLQNGCFVYMQNSEIMIHEKVCTMRKITCDLCTVLSFYKNHYFEHMIQEHEMQVLGATPAVVQPGYFSYEGKVFRFGFNTEKSETDTKYYWFLYVVHSPEIITSFKYSMTIKMGDQISIINSKTLINEMRHCLSYPYVLNDNPIFELTF